MIEIMQKCSQLLGKRGGKAFAAEQKLENLRQEYQN